MTQTLVKYLIFCFCCLYGNSAIGQSSYRHSICLTIPEIAILDIEPSNLPINLSINAPTESGESVSIPKEDASKWLNYTSAISPSGANRSVAAQISGNSIPEGLQLYLEASTYQGNGGGMLGKAMGKVSLNNSPKTIISDIGRGYTGNGNNNGHQLIYSLSIANYEALKAESSQQVTVIFTITE